MFSVNAEVLNKMVGLTVKTSLNEISIRETNKIPLTIEGDLDGMHRDTVIKVTIPEGIDIVNDYNSINSKDIVSEISIQDNIMYFTLKDNIKGKFVLNVNTEISESLTDSILLKIKAEFKSTYDEILNISENSMEGVDSQYNSITFTENAELNLEIPAKILPIEVADEAIPLVGDINLDLDLSEEKKEIEAGTSGIYILNLKVTGSTKIYKNAKIEVKLPTNDNVSFNQELSDLNIAGINPVYNNDTNTLNYNFPELETGKTYKVLIHVKTENGLIYNDTELKAIATFSADGFANVEDDANIIVKSNTPVSVSKSYKSTVDKENGEVPKKGDTGVWNIKVNIPKNATGLLYLKEGSKIVVEDTIPNGTTFHIEDNSFSDWKQIGNKVVWEFDAPTIEQQKNENNQLFSQDLSLKLRFNSDLSDFANIKNDVSVKVTDLSGKVITEIASAEVQIGGSNNETPIPDGNFLIPHHYGPIDGFDTYHQGGEYDPTPDVYDWATLKFISSVGGVGGITPNKDFKSYIFEYNIDPNLIFKKFWIPNDFVYSRYWEENEPLSRAPKINVYILANGQWREYPNAILGREYTREDFGLSDSDRVDAIKVDFNDAPYGFYTKGGLDFSFTVKKGYVGSVENTARYYGIDGNGISFDMKSDINGPRHANINPEPKDQPPIAEVKVWLNNHNGNVVQVGDNKLSGSILNNESSLNMMNGKIQQSVLLPKGITIVENTFESTDARGIWGNNNGKIEVLDNNFNGTGQQLVRITWKETELRPRQSLEFKVDVKISTDTDGDLIFNTYGYSDNDKLSVPKYSDNLITNSSIEIDSEDFDKDGNNSEERLKSGNKYTITKDASIETEKLVKGSLDSEYSRFGHTSPSGSIAYKLRIKNVGNNKISKFVLLDVLPSINDLGITDGVERDSKFTPVLTGPIEVPTEWKDKVSVLYSTSKNPKRDDLIKNVNYPDSSEQLTNPAGVEEPNWMEASKVTDWSKIHSFKIELLENQVLDINDTIELNFNMKAPDSNEVSEDITNTNVDELFRAAWNSFAIAVNDLQAVEPAKVGVVINKEKPVINKDVEGQEHLDLANRNDKFNWNIRVQFGNDTASWEQAVIQDEINELLEIVDTVKVVDAKGQDVTSNGTLEVNGNSVKFTLNKKDDSFAYLAGQTYKVIVTTKIRDNVTDEQLAPYIKDGGVPNQADLVFGPAGDGEIIKSEIPTVTPPIEKPVINKDVEGQEHLDLANRNDKFNWNIRVQFGNDTASWEQAVIQDEINELLEIVDTVKVVDAKGQDVTSNGTLEVNGNSVKFTLNKKDDSFAYLAGQTYKVIVTTKIRDNVTDEQLAPYIKDGGVPNQADLVFGPAGDGEIIKSEIPTVTPPIEKPVINKDVEGQEHLDLANRNDKFNWNIRVQFGNDTASWEQAVIQDEINELLEIVDTVKVVDAKGQDVTSNGTLEVNGNSVKFTLNKKDDSFAYLAGQTYKVIVTTKIRDNVTDEQLAPYIKDGGVPNQADLVFGPAGDGEIIKSEIPTVTPPIEKPVINKDVEGQEHLDLANRNDKFNWNIRVQFGNDTASWEQAVIQDEINELLEIVDTVKVVDAKGQDVTSNGTLEVNGNSVKFTLNKKDDSFAYLAGQTYKVIVTTKIRDNVTDEQLAPYIKDGGVPNQADLVFGPAGDGEIIKSEIPTVTPPIEKPVINKDVEGQEHLDLANRNDKFNWNIRVQFGNDTASWEQAVIQDEINELLEIVDTVKVVDAKGQDVTSNGTLEVNGNSVKFTLNKKDDSFAYLAGQTYKVIVTTKIRDNVTDEQLAPYIKDGGVPNQADLVFGPAGDGEIIKSEIPTVTPPIEKPVINKDVEGQEHLDLANRNDKFNWNIRVQFGNDTASWEQAVIQDEINELLEIVDTVKVVDAKGQDVTSNGTLEVNGNSVKFTLNKKDDSFAYLAGQTYKVIVTTKIRDNVTDEQLAPYIKDGGVPNQADLVFGPAGDGEIIKSEIPTVTPPIEKPVINKDVEGQEHLDLANRNDKFNWNIRVQFGNDTASWEQAVIQDEINELLEIVDTVKVVDAKGQDVTSNGTLEVNGNSVKFTLNKKDDSFAYLAGQTYKVIVTTKIRDNVTDEQLAPYIKDGGVPNQADLVFGPAGDGEIIKSEIPTVTPPIEKPVINKDVEGQEHLDLANRNDKFNWNIRVQFGNDTASWEQAVIQDEINELLEIVDTVKVVDAKGQDVTSNGTLEVNGNSVKFTLNKKDDSFAYLAGQTYKVIVTTKIRDNVTDEQLAPYIKDGGVPNQADLVFGPAGDGEIIKSEIPTVTPPIEKPVINKDVEGQEHLDLANRNDKFNWNIRVQFGNDTASWEQAVIQDEINELLEIVDTVKVVDAKGQDVTSNGTLEVNGNSVKFTLNKKDDSFAYLAGQTYKVIVTTKIRDNVTDEQLAPYIKDGGVPNQADLVFGPAGDGEIIKSEIPTVTPPIEKPVINKDVEGQEHLDLANRNDKFNWNIRVQFGNDTASWEQAVIQDEINELLEIVDTVKVVDAKGQDVTSNGTLEVNGNSVKFTLNKKDDSFAYLAGQTYKVIVTTKIRDNVTDEQLAPYIKDGGVPNQADLVFGPAGDGEIIKSEIPTVTPPIEKPVINKDVEGQEHLDLANRNDKFNWNIRVQFGNDTASWEQAVIQDEINELLEIVDTVKVVDAKGQDVTSNGTLEVNGNSVKFTLNKKDDSFAYLAGQTYKVIVTTKIRDNVTDEQLAPYIKDGGVPNQADLVFGPAGDGEIIKSEIPTVTPPIEKPVINKDVEGQEHLDLANRNDKFNWNIRVQFGNDTASWEQAVIQDEINELLEIVDTVKVVDAKGQDVTSNGTLEVNGNSVKFTLNKKDDSFAYLAGQTYKVIVTTKIRDNVTDEQLAPYIKDGGVPNQADLVFGPAGDGEIIKSEIPTVTPPIEKPVINKDVEGQEHLDLANRNDKFNWNIRVQFGNDTASWEQAVIQDEINELLEIVDTVKVVDAKGQDVTSNGTLEVNGNSVKFTLNKKDDSFAYLAGQTYKVIVTTKIRDNVTDEQLAPYIKDGGVPNQADLVFGPAGDGEIIKSEIPTVTPPIEKPVINKDVEGQEHLDLANRNDKFNWNIRVQFGNDTASWEQAVIQDEINELLEIVDTVKVVDAKGQDVTSNGTLEVNGNSVKFTLNKKDDSFAYLAGQTYKVIVTTKIRDNVTDEQLAPYIKDGGVPNQADLVFGPAGDGEIIKSEIPTVTPPIEKPVINKDVEGQEHLDLANRNDKFNWNIRVQFGNDTASWEQAVIQDEINELLEIVDTVKVVDAKGQDVTSNGTLEVNGNSVKFTLNKKDDSFAYLAGQTYKVIVTTKIRDNVTDEQLAPYIKDGGVPNQADLVFGPAGDGEIIKSEIPTVTPPIEKNPTIDKLPNTGNENYSIIFACILMLMGIVVYKKKYI
ncbi:isopeptide-forming domain-containing fimbrial protein (plasmid) [Clostridium perfringens]